MFEDLLNFLSGVDGTFLHSHKCVLVSQVLCFLCLGAAFGCATIFYFYLGGVQRWFLVSRHAHKQSVEHFAWLLDNLHLLILMSTSCQC